MPAFRVSCLLALLTAGFAGVAHAADAPLRQQIDAELQAAWKRGLVTPTGPASDSAFLRRVSIDLVGTVPSYEEAKKFLEDTDPQKRTKLIDKLLADPRFAQNQANVWDLTLFGRRPGNSEQVRQRDGFRKWMTNQFATNVPYDKWVKELLLAQQDGTEYFYVQFRNQPEEATVTVTRTFLGTQLHCARCHDHPFGGFKQREFYGMAGFFVRLVVEESGSGNNRKFNIAEKSTGEVLFTGPAKEQKPGKKGEPVKPKFLGGPELDDPPLPKDFKEPDTKGGAKLPRPVFSRKEKLAEWVTAPDNPYFARAAVNRVWGQFMGRGLVHPVDDFHDANPPSHPALLKAMAEQFAAQKYDLKWLIREIVSSDAYQLAGGGPVKEALPGHFERARVRPLSAEEVVAALRTATGYDGPGVAAKLPNSGDEYFLRYFGEPTNGLGDFQGSLAEHLFLNNSDQVRGLIRRKKDNLADRVLTSTEPWEKRVDVLFLSTLSRPPRPEERKKFVEYLTADPKPEARVEEAIWVLLNTSEFRFNH